MFDVRENQDSSLAPPEKSGSDWTRQVVENTPTVAGLYMLANAQEYPCEARCLTGDGAEIVAAKPGGQGEWIILYLDNIGIVIGRIERLTDEGFAVSLHVTSERRARIRARIEWHAFAASERTEQRGAPRVVPLQTEVEVLLASGLSAPGTIVDLSLSGAAVRSPAVRQVALGQGVWLGRTAGTVVRRFEDGFAVQFRRPFTSKQFVPEIRL